MRKFFLLSAILALSPLLAADSSSGLTDEKIRAEVRLGDLAMGKGDFDNAVDYFSSALARPGLDRKQRGDIILKLVRAQLYGGNVDAAAMLMKQFENEYPERYAGLIQGEILQKTGKTKEAKSFFSDLFGRSDNSLDKSEILYRLAEVEIAEREYQQAKDHLDQLLKINDEKWVAQAKLTKIFVLIRNGEYPAASQALDEFESDGNTPPGGAFRSKTLRLLLTAEIGDAEKFLQLWSDFSKSYAPAGNQIITEALGKVAQHLIKDGKKVEAESILESSLSWQILDSDRQDTMRDIMALQTAESGDADAAASTAEKYQELFPHAEDRIDMINRAADKLYRSDKFDRALEFYLQVGRDAATPKKIAVSALRNAAKTAEKLDKRDLEKTIYQELIQLDQDVVEMRKDRIEFGEFLYNIGEFDEAVKVLENVSGDESAERLLTLAAFSAGEKAIARRVATQLSNSKDPQSAGFGLYYLARLAEDEGDFSGARERYLQYVREYAADAPFTDEAGFRAALLGWKSGIDDKALELEEFAKNNPKSANAPNALLVAIQAKRGLDETRAVFNVMKENYPGSPELKSAVLILLQQLIQYRDRDGFFALLNESEKWFSAAQESAEYGLVKLYGINAFDGAAAAEPYGNELMQKYPAKDFPEITYFCGNIEAVLGKYEKALECFRSVVEYRPAGQIFFYASGRRADMELELALANKDNAALERAKDIYDTLSKESLGTDTEIKIESTYKLAFCQELSGDKSKALKSYKEVLIIAEDMRNRGIAPQEVWCVRAICRAVKILIDQRPPNYINKAVNDYISYAQKLGLDNTGENFTEMEKDVSNLNKASKK